eukprot:3186016-Pleurochrysis_carterae.AAC.1
MLSSAYYPAQPRLLTPRPPNKCSRLCCSLASPISRSRLPPILPNIQASLLERVAPSKQDPPSLNAALRCARARWARTHPDVERDVFGREYDESLVVLAAEVSMCAMRQAK